MTDFASRGTESGDGWREWEGHNFEVSEGSVRVATDPFPAYVSPDPVETPPGFDPVDLDADGCGNVYALVASGTVYRYDPRQDAVERLPCTWREADAGPAAGLCVTRHSVYVAAADGRVQAYSRERLQTRWIADAALTAPLALVEAGGTVLALDAGADDEPGSLVRIGPGGDAERVLEGLADPTDVAVDAEGTIHVLEGSGTIRRYDAGYEAVGDPIEVDSLEATCIAVEGAGGLIVGVGPESPGEPSLFRYRPSTGSFERVAGLREHCSDVLVVDADAGGPRGLYAVAGPDPTLYALAAETRRQLNEATGRYDAQLVRRIDAGERATQWHRVTAELSRLGRAAGGERPGEGAGTSVRLRYVAVEDDSLEYGVGPTDLRDVPGIGRTYAERLREVGVGSLPELLEAGRERVAAAASGDHLEVTPAEAAAWIDEAEDLVAAGGHPDGLRAVGGIGSIYAGRLREGGIEDLQGLAASDPPSVVAVVTADVTEADRRTADEWIEEARERLLEADDVRGLDWTEAGPPTPDDVLLEDAEGRYLWVRFDLVGDARESPRIDAARAYFPRQSYLRHMPAAYRQDPASAAFLERFLSIMESTLVDVGEDIESATRYLDPDGIPEEYLSWLGQWLGVELDEDWPEPARRELLREAPRLFTKRGTPEGLLETLGIYLDHVDAEGRAGRLPEGFEWDDEPTATPASEPVPTTEDGRPLAYLLEYADLDCIDDPGARVAYERLVPCPQCYLLLARSWLDDEAVRAIEGVVESHQPAHAVGQAARLQPWIELGGSSFLGVNSTLPERDFRLEESGLGRDATLVEREPFGQLGSRARLETDTELS